MQKKIIIPKNPAGIFMRQCFFLIRDEQSGSSFPIFIGMPELQSIAVAALGAELPRPLSHDSWKNSLIMAGVMLEKIVINKFEGDTYYAEIYLNIAGKVRKMDCRPSDAVALALRFESPMFIEEQILFSILDNENNKKIMDFIDKHPEIMDLWG